jgi:hypothetical protein
MRVFEKLAAVPEKFYVLVFFGIFLVTAFSAYFTRQDTAVLEGRIAAKQRDLASVLQLRDAYEAKKHEMDRRVLKKVESQPLSLTLVESMVNKSFVGGSLSALSPSTEKGEKGSRRTAVDLKIAGAALGEIVTFVKAAENAGLRVEKIRLTLPASNPMALDLQATIVERRSHG